MIKTHSDHLARNLGYAIVGIAVVDIHVLCKHFEYIPCSCKTPNTHAIDWIFEFFIALQKAWAEHVLYIQLYDLHCNRLCGHRLSAAECVFSREVCVNRLK